MPSIAPSSCLISSAFGFVRRFIDTLFHQPYVLLHSLNKTHLTSLQLLLHLTIRTSWSESSPFAVRFWETVHTSRATTRNKVRTICCHTLKTSITRQANHGFLELNQQQVELVDSLGIGRSASISHSPNASSAAQDFCHDNPTNDYLSRNTVDETVNSLPVEEAPAYTECGEYAFAHKKGHGVITGKRAQFTRCEDEEIHIPNTIQAHGMLVGLKIIGDTNPRYLVRVVSENSEAICKYTPRALLALGDFFSIVFAPHRSNFHRCAVDVRTQFENSGKSQEPKVFPIKFQDKEGKRIPVWCAVHFVGGNHNLLICEFEPQNSPSLQKTTGDLPPTPYSSLDSNPLDAASSFTNKSTPLYINVNNTFRGEGSAVELLDVISQVQHQLSSQKDIQSLLDNVVGLMMQITGYHRCIVYQFGLCIAPDFCNF